MCRKRSTRCPSSLLTNGFVWVPSVGKHGRASESHFVLVLLALLALTHLRHATAGFSTLSRVRHAVPPLCLSYRLVRLEFSCSDGKIEAELLSQRGLNFQGDGLPREHRAASLWTFQRWQRLGTGSTCTIDNSNSSAVLAYTASSRLARRTGAGQDLMQLSNGRFYRRLYV